MSSNQEKIHYIEQTLINKGYNLNAFKLAYVNGHRDVVWNIPIAPHRVCEYFRQHNVKIIPIKGSYDMTSLWFDADSFPNRLYELVDGLPEYDPKHKKVMKYDINGAYDFLSKSYPTMVRAVKEHYPEYKPVDVIDFLINRLNFKEFIVALSDDTYIIDDIMV